MTPQEEIIDAFKTVGIIIRAKIERFCNEGRFNQAKELEEAYNVVNNNFNDLMSFKQEGKK
jgi:hypothetical protein